MNKPTLSMEELKKAVLQKRLSERMRAQQPDAAAHAIPVADRHQPLPLSWSQQRLWFLDQLDSAAGAAYHLPAALQLRGQLNRAALQASLDRIVARHEILRTTFISGDGEPVQRIHAPQAFDLPLSDLRAQPDAEAHAQVLAAEEAHAPFDLSRGLLLRGRLLQLADDDHILLLTQHHIVSDGWSVGVLVREFSALYGAFKQGLPDPLPPLPFQYADYAAWQRKELKPEALRTQAEYWQSQLSGAPHLLTLPTDRPRPAVQRYAGDQLSWTLAPTVSTNLRRLCQRHGVTLFMAGLAAWSVLLSRWSGQDDLVIGIPMANRQQDGLDSLIGLFVNTLALRIQLHDAPSVETLLARIKQQLIESHTCQDVPFEQVVEALQPPRSLGHSPVFQVALAMNNTPGGVLDLPGMTLQALEPATRTAHFDLTLYLQEAGEQIECRLSYASDLFDRATIQCMARQYEHVLHGMTADPERPVDRLPLQDHAERHQLVEAFNATAVPYPDDGLIHQLFEQHALAQPDAIALLHNHESLNYGELNRRANRLAHALIAQGVGLEDRVAICMERSIALIVGVLGILKAGAAYVPLDPAYPAERLAYMLRDSAPSALLTQASLETCWDAAGVPVLVLDDQGALPTLATQPSHNPERYGLTSRHLAYMMYTSGSTGEPKGVMVEHRSVLRLVINNYFAPVTAEDCVVHCAKIAFDASTWEVWAGLLHGARVLLIDEDVLLDAARFVQALRAGQVTAMFLTTALFNQYADVLAPILPNFRYLLFGGEAADARIVRRVLASTPPQHLLNIYGPTETTTFASRLEITTVAEEATSLPIGRAIANTRMYILDRYGEPVPTGVPGEIHIGGPGVARGYWNRPQLTAERFLFDPFADDPQARMYKTGDLGRWLANGQVEYLGRNDFQVKIRGFRIELGEIESKLTACDGVREAVVIAREDGPGDKRLVAYLTAHDEQVLSAAALRDALAQVLADYMLPSAFVQLAQLPLTPNGKLDRQALPAPDQQAVVTRAYEAPQGDTEQAIAAIWQDLLKLERVGRHDHFFELGGHSLLAVQVIARLRQRLDVALSLRDLFAQPTVQALAQVVADDVPVALMPIPVADRSAELPLSWAQQRLWFIHQLDPAASVAYHMPAGLRLHGCLDIDALQAAFDRIVMRHDVLRTRFASVEGRPVQVIDAAARVPLPLHDLRGHAEAAIQRLMREEAQAPFDLSHGPLLRAHLLQMADDEHILLLTQHHIVSDGWSIDVLVRELSALYGAFRRGHPDPLPALPIQYADYAAWQRDETQCAILQTQSAYWKNQLSGAPGLLSLPVDRPRPAVQSYAGDQITWTLTPEAGQALRTLSQRHGTTLFMTALAAWSVVLSRWSGQTDLVIGTPVANRPRSELEPLIGFFVNTLALRMRLEDAPTVAALLARIKPQLIEAYAHQALPFEQVVEAVQPVRSLSHSPVFQVVLSMNNTTGAVLDLPGLHCDVLEPERTTAHFDVTLSLREEAGQLVGNLSYASDLFDRATMARMARHFMRVLESMAADDRQPVDRLAMLDHDERRQMLTSFSASTEAASVPTLIHALFEQQAQRTPDAIALSHEAQSLTYAELNQQANRVAHALIARGIRPDDRVALGVERGLAMVVGILGILKAGAGYVPLDPSYPVERLAYLLEDSVPALLLAPSSPHALWPGGLTVLHLDDPSLAAQPTHDPKVDGLHAHHLAYVIYTSGSTGQPKGVMVEHAQVARLLATTDAPFGFGPGDVWTLFHSYAFDFSVWELWGALAYGGRLVIVPSLCARSPSDFYDLLCREQVTVLNQTPSAFRALIAAQDAGQHRLRYVIFGGEALELHTLQPWIERNDTSRTRLINMYGITETTVHVTYREITQADIEAGKGSLIGRSLPDLHVYLLDPHGEPVPIGVTGEIYVGGAGVARGYWNRPQLTAARFLPNPFVDDPQARLYKSGDLGRWLPNGDIEYLGRNDFQVKIRGFRIELGEIEAKLAKQPHVRDAVVIAREDAPGDKRLVAYFTVQDEQSLSVAGLRAALSSELAEHMLPSAFVPLQQWPLTANGKLDRNALPAPDQQAVITRDYEAPQGDTEHAIAAIWQELLGLRQVGRQDHFFELGGHSLLAVQMLARVRKVLGVEVSLRDLFARSSLQDLAVAATRAARVELADIRVADRTQPLPLSWAQQRLWFIEQLDAEASAAYHMPMGLRLRGNLDRPALAAALGRIAERHEILRTVFVAQNGQPVQRIRAAQAFDLPVHDLRTEPDAEMAIQRVSAEEASAPFALSTGPLWRGRLLQVADDEHILLLTQHHIVSDGWSIGVLVKEFCALYAAFSHGQADPLPPLPLQYADYASWQRNEWQPHVQQAQLAFWKQHLSGAPHVLALPTDRPRPPVQRHFGAEVSWHLAPLLAERLRRFNQRHGVTLFMTALATWSVVLSRWSGQSDLVIGTPVANRQRSELEPLIGFFVNTLALRVRLDEAPTVEALLASIRQQTIDAYAHQDLPFEQVVEALQPPRSLSHSPVFQVMLSVDNTPAVALDLPGLALQSMEPATHTAHFDLTLALREEGERITCNLAYATDLFDRSTVERMAKHIEHLLEGITADAQQALDRLPLMDAAECQQVLETFNATTVAYPDDTLIHRLFEAQAAARPDAIALVCGRQRISYGELNRRANQLARRLMAFDLRPDDRVAVCVERGTDRVIGMLGAMKAGAAYVPLDPAYPQERLAFMLQDSAPVALLTQSELIGHLPAHDAPVLLLDQHDEWAATPAHNPDDVARAPHHLAYVIYTSGSTGRPKGVMNHHSGLCNLIAAQIETFGITPASGVLQFASCSFDASIWEMMLALCAGASLHLPQQGDLLVGTALQGMLAGGGITHVFLSPAALASLPAGEALGDVHTIVAGGDVLLPSLANRWVDTYRLFNAYGPTEITVCATVHRCLAGNLKLPIGAPIANTRVYVLDTHGQPVPIGVPGEIHIGGVGVARGYLHRDALSAERFLRDPFVDDPQARMYKSGDLGRWLPNGEIEYLGRNDFQVKLRGFRIELGEIEAKLAACAGVREAVVVAREDLPGDKRLVAYVTSHDQQALSAAFLRDALATELADYMLPSAFVQLDHLPLTPNGKLDRQALPAPDWQAVIARDYEAPQGAVEQAIASIWQELFGLERVGRHDHFFELGGHSLMIVSMIERLRREGWRASVKNVFASPTLSALAVELVDTAADEPSVPRNLIPEGSAAITPAMLSLVELSQGEIDRVVTNTVGGAANIQDIYPLSPLQEGMLFHHLLEVEGDAYLLRTVLAFEQKGQLDAFLAATQQVIDRHDILRSAVHWQGLSSPVQVVHRHASLPVQELHLTTAQDVEAALLEHTDPRRKRLDLSRAPLLHAFVTQNTDTGEWMLSLLHHHLIGDHVTLEQMVQEIQVILRGRHEHLPLPVPYRNFVAHARSIPASVHEAYFRERLGDIEQPTCLFGVMNVQADGRAIREARVTLDDDLAGRVRECARRYGISTAVLFHVAWAQVLACCTGQDDVVFGTVLAGRSQGAEAADRALGLFINTLPLRVSVADRSVRQVVEETHRHLGKLLTHEQASLALAQRCSGVAADVPLFNTILNYRHSLIEPNTEQGRWHGMRTVHAEERTNYPVSLSVDDMGAGFGVVAQCVGAIDPERLTGYTCTVMQGLMDALGEQEQRPMHSVPVLDAAGRNQVMDAFNLAATPYPSDSLIHQVFEQQALSRPDAIALLHNGVSLSYGELNRRANQLAHALITQGVGPDDRVAICMERSIALIVGLLGILKAGGAYVPLEPAYPDERLAYMLRDSAPSILLSQPSLQARCSSTGGTPILILDSDGCIESSAQQPSHNPERRDLTSRHLAYVIYTSGSTGAPKGVMVEHRGVLRLVINQRFAQVEPEDCIVHAAKIAFDASTWEVWGGLLNGARVLLVDESALLDPARFTQILAAGQATMMFLTTALFNQYADALAPILPNFRYLVFGGEAADARTVRRVLASGSPRHLLNAYGPTEATAMASHYEIRDVTVGAVSLPIGSAISNTRIYILDRHGQPVPVGVPGEIHIGGPGVARGYWNRPELTAERFLPDPFGDDSQARVYKSGDLARWLPDGNIEYLGRNDSQVKIRGFRIELGEIEAKLAACDGVRDALVIAREDMPGDKRLVAYITTRNGQVLPVATLRDALAKELAAYMLPSAFVQLEQWPLTPNGKLDRKALPLPDHQAIVTRDYAAPQGEVEEAIATIWQALLGLDQVGRQDHFFELGGHSLHAVQCVSRLQQRLGIDVSLRMLFSHPALANFAAAMERPAGDISGDIVTIRSQGSQLPLFLVHAGGGEVGYAATLARWLAADMPVYGFAAQGLQQGETPLATAREMAARYIRAMRRIQPEGPYRIVGYSAGGVIAYEMAYQLLGADAAVAFVGLIDTLSDYRDTEAEQVLELDGMAMLLWLARVAPDEVRQRALALAEQGDRDAVLMHIQQAGLLPGDVDRGYIHRQLAVTRATCAAVYHYLPSTLPVPVTLFSAREEQRDDPANGWGQWVPAERLRLVPVEGTHTSLMEAPHIEGLGKTLSEALAATEASGLRQLEAHYAPCIAIQSGKRGVVPLFCIPGAGDSAAGFHELSQALPRHTPVYGLQPRGLDGEMIPHVDVGSAARAYVQAIKGVQAEGPYQLLGHSFGGWVAFEMALQLAAQGDSVAGLYLLDSRAPREDWGGPVHRLRTLMKLVELYDLRLEKPLPLTEWHFQGLSAVEQIALLHRALVDARLLHRMTPASVLHGVVRVLEANLATDYLPQTIYAGPVHLISAQDDKRDKQKRAESWRIHAPDLQHHLLPGNHITMLAGAHAAGLGEWLSARMIQPSGPQRSAADALAFTSDS